MIIIYSNRYDQTFSVERVTREVTVERVGRRGLQGLPGDPGSEGPEGPQGPEGEGVAPGGTTGQVLSKASNDDFDTEWADVEGTGDMQKSTYDPQSIESDAFNRSNHTGTQPVSSVLGLQDDLDEKADSSSLSTVATTGDYSDLEGKPTIPTTFDQLSDGTVNKAFTNTEKEKLQTVAVGAEVNVNADWNSVSGDSQILNRPSLGTASAANTGVSSGNVPVLDGSGKLSNSVIPSLAVSNTYVVNSQVAQLALSTEEGDVVVRTDQSKTYIRNSGTTGTMSDFTEMLSPTADVSSVFGRVGAVTAQNGDYTTATVPDSTDKRYVTEVEKTKLSNTSGTNTGDQNSVTGNAGTATALQNARTIDGQSFDGTSNITVIAPGTVAATSKSTPVDADVIPLADSAASNVLKKLTWGNLKATLKTYFDSLSTTLSNKTLAAPILTGSVTADSILWIDNEITATSNSATVPVTHRLSTVTNNSAATLTITLTTSGASDGQLLMVRVYDFSAVSQTLAWVNTENSTSSVPLASNGSTTLPLTAGFQFNGATSKWRCVAAA